MTAKTTLVQLHHKVQTFEHLSKHLVLVDQECLTAYMKRRFSFDHLAAARLGDPMHFHSYTLQESADGPLRLRLGERLSTDSAGIATCLGLQGEANVELTDMLEQLTAKISAQTLLRMERPPAPASLAEDAEDQS